MAQTSLATSPSFKRRLLCAALLCLSLAVSSVSAKCPSVKSAWCLQIDGFDTIILDGNKFHDIKGLFSKIKFLFEDENESTELDQLMLYNNHNIKTLGPNAFGDFRFRKIIIKNCTNLSRIQADAFNGTVTILKQLSFESIGVNEHTQEEFFDSLNSLTNLEELELRHHKIVKIRPYTFRQVRLNRLHLDGPLELLENQSFLYLDSLRILHLSKSISHIQAHAFDMKAANKTVDIYLDGKLGFLERGVFTYTTRPLTINLFLKKLSTFDAAIWRPVLLAPIAHEIIFHGHPKEMHNPCQLIWIFRQKFRGVVTFKDEPQISEAYFNPWQCSYQAETAPSESGDEIPEIDDINRAGIDASHNAAPTVTGVTQRIHLLVALVSLYFGALLFH